MNMNYMVEEAASLLDPSGLEDNPEYVRGMAELIARTFPEQDVCTDDRAEAVQEEIRRRVEQ